MDKDVCSQRKDYSHYMNPSADFDHVGTLHIESRIPVNPESMQMSELENEFESLLHLVDESLFANEVEDEMKEDSVEEIMPARTIKLEAEWMASIDAFIADIKKKSKPILSTEQGSSSAHSRAPRHTSPVLKSQFVEKSKPIIPLREQGSSSTRSRPPRHTSPVCRSPRSTHFKRSRSPSAHYRRPSSVHSRSTRNTSPVRRSHFKRSRSPSSHSRKIGIPSAIGAHHKSSSPDQKKGKLDSYYCKVCHISLTSEVTWHSHKTGKKHAKAMKVSKVHEITRSTLARPSTSFSADIPRFRHRSVTASSAFTKTSRSLIKDKRQRGYEPKICNNDCLDTSKSTFHCKICDAHMQTLVMWVSHVKGKRHLKNTKKIKGENMSRLKFVKAPNQQSQLKKLIENEADGEMYVGLEFIRETHAFGIKYTCFLCGACCTNVDILSHLVLTKHRKKYLESLAANGKCDLNVLSIDIAHEGLRKALIDEQCHHMLKKYGTGPVEVYISK